VKHLSEDLMLRYIALPEPGRTYLLGWLVGAIRDEGQATSATLEAALPLAERWAANWDKKAVTR
jgi:hypothetical protein